MGAPSGGAGEERDGAQVLGAGEALPGEHDPQVVLLVAGREARGHGAVERGAQRLADGGRVEAEVAGALAVQLDGELGRGLVGGRLQVLEAGTPRHAVHDVVGDALELVQVVALDVEGDGGAGGRGAEPPDLRRPDEDPGAGEAVLVDPALERLHPLRRRS
jgi:hypothetical protein